MFLALKSELQTKFSRLNGRIFTDPAERGSTVPSVDIFVVSGGSDSFRDVQLANGRFGRVQVNCHHEKRESAYVMAGQIAAHFEYINNLGLYMLGASDPSCACAVQVDRVEVTEPRFLSRPSGSRIFTVSIDVVLQYVQSQILVEVI